MSGSFGEDWCWTENEIEAGIPSIWGRDINKNEQSTDKYSCYMFGDEPESKYQVFFRAPTENDRVNFVSAEFEFGLSKAIYALKNKEDIQKKVVNKLIYFGIDIAVRRYGKDESLPKRYQLLSQNKECLRLLLQDFFLCKENITLTPSLNNRLENFVNTLIKKDESKIAYQKVSELRDFIHHIVNLEKGDGAALLCDRKEMRLILSTARLHLSINELTKHHTTDLIGLQKRYISLKAVEAFLPTANDLPGRKNIYRWRLRHYRSLLYYFPIEIRRALLDFMQHQGLFSLDAISNLEDYKQAIIAHCCKAVENFLRRKKY